MEQVKIKGSKGRLRKSNVYVGVSISLFQVKRNKFIIVQYIHQLLTPSGPFRIQPTAKGKFFSNLQNPTKLFSNIHTTKPTKKFIEATPFSSVMCVVALLSLNSKPSTLTEFTLLSDKIYIISKNNLIVYIDKYECLLSFSCYDLIRKTQRVCLCT